MADDKDKRIGELEDGKRRDERIAELKDEVLVAACGSFWSSATLRVGRVLLAYCRCGDRQIASSAACKR